MLFRSILGSELTEDNLIRAWQYLMDSAIKPPYTTIVSPATYAGFLKVDKFTNQLYIGESPRAVRQAEVGNLYSSKVYVSQLTVGTAPNSSGHVWGHIDSGGHFFKIIQKPPTTDTWYSPLAKAWIMAADQIYGVFERQEADEAAAVTTTARLGGVRLQSLK